MSVLTVICAHCEGTLEIIAVPAGTLVPQQRINDLMHAHDCEKAP